MITLSIIGGFALWFLGAAFAYEALEMEDSPDSLWGWFLVLIWVLWVPPVCIMLGACSIIAELHYFTFGRWRR